MSVPALRFKDEAGQTFPDWKGKTIGDVLSIGSGKDYKHLSKGDIPVYGTGGYMLSVDKYLYDGESVCIGRKGTIDKPKLLTGKFWTVDTLFYTHSFKNSLPKFIYAIFQMIDWKNYNEASGVPSLSKSTIEKIEISLPSIAEQTKIANFLTAVDEKITQLTQKHDLLTQYKKGVMQQIFSQELRFKDDDGQDFPEWEDKALGSVAEITTGSSNRIDSTVGDGAHTFFDRSQDIRTSDIYLFDCEAVIVAGEGQEFVPKHFVGKFDLHQRTYAIMSFRNLDGKYLFYYIHQHRGYFLSQAVGSTVKSLRLPMFQKMPVKIPCMKEQTNIANFLTAIDDKIAATQTQLQAVKQYKQGLLQQMFV
jgi:type I restriction enzyme, S subunit